EGALGQGEYGVEIVFLNANGRVRDLFKRNGTVRMAASLVVGDVAILSPTSYGDVDGSGTDRGSYPVSRGGQQPEPLLLGAGRLSRARPGPPGGGNRPNRGAGGPARPCRIPP